MKFNYLLIIFALLIFSCSSDDSNEPDNGPVVITGDYFPSTLNDSWTYDVENTSTTNPEVNYSETDVVTINSSSSNSFTIEVNNGSGQIFGTSNAILSNGTFTKSDSTLDYDGDISLLADAGILPNSNINVTDFTLYDLNATVNSELANASDTFTQNIDLDGISVPLTIAYEVTNTNLNSLNALIVNGVSFDDIIHTEIRLNLSISGTFTILGIPTTQSILDPQDALVIDHYYAKDVGLIKSEARQSFMLNSTFIALLQTLGGNVDIPANVIVDNVQDLNTYSVSSN